MKNIKLIPYLALGALIFTFNSTLEFNYLVKGYITLLEMQAGIAILYLLVMPKIKKQKI